MDTSVERVHIGLEDAEHEDFFREATKKPGRFDQWNLVGDAKIGELVVVYVQENVCSFVGTCRIDSEAIPKPANKKEQRLKTWFHVADAQLLPDGDVHLHDFKTCFGDEWRFHGRPGVTCVPREGEVSAEIVREFLEFLCIRPSHYTEIGVVEGINREQHRYQKSRNRGLRDRAIRNSKGICEACLEDFSALLNGLGKKCLHVHHRDQLALADEPVITKIEDLAVVCANCHMMIHADRFKAMKVEELKQKLLDHRMATKGKE